MPKSTSEVSNLENNIDEVKSKYVSRVILLLTFVNYLNYIDRYVLSAVLASIQKDLSLSDFQAGLLATAFMLSYMFTSPLFGWLGDTTKRPLLIGSGAMLWSFASLITGMAPNFNLLFISRFLLGFGESAFTTISIPYLSDFISSEKRGRILSIFSSAVPVGAALGFLLGGVLGQLIGWRGAFYVVGFPGIILALLVIRLPDPFRSKGLTKSEESNSTTNSSSDSKPNIKRMLRHLVSVPAYVYSVAGYCAYSFTLGGVAHWIPTYLQRVFALKQLTANMVFGGIAVGSGIVGTMLGGYLGDYWEKRKGQGHLKVSSLSMALGAPFFILCVLTSNWYLFIFSLVLCQLFFFVSTSPINVALMSYVSKQYKTSAMAIGIFFCHILGDAISAPLIGKISDYYGGSLKHGLLICAPAIVLSSFFWFIAAKKARTSRTFDQLNRIEP